jgi:hypothetical protein
MELSSIIFFNHWHYGDLFSTRGLIDDIRSQLPDNFPLLYAHYKNPAATADVAQQLDKQNCAILLNKIYERNPFLNGPDTIFINTWVGAYQGLWPNTHPSYISHHVIYGHLYHALKNNYGLEFKLNPDVWHYVPDIDYSVIDRSVTDKFVQNASGKIFLFCNGGVQSTQSSMGNMAQTIIWLSKVYTDDTFVATERFETNQPNIVFTDDIYNKPCDIIDISYLSRSSHLIVGKNSGPFTYASTKSNLKDPTKMFWCFSHKPEDVLPYGLDLKCDFRFSTVTSDVEASAQLSKGIRLIHEYNLTPGWNTEEYQND